MRGPGAGRSAGPAARARNRSPDRRGGRTRSRARRRPGPGSWGLEPGDASCGPMRRRGRAGSLPRDAAAPAPGPGSPSGLQGRRQRSTAAARWCDRERGEAIRPASGDRRAHCASLRAECRSPSPPSDRCARRRSARRTPRRRCVPDSRCGRCRRTRPRRPPSHKRGRSKSPVDARRPTHSSAGVRPDGFE